MSTYYDIQSALHLITQTYRDDVSLRDIKELESLIIADAAYNVDHDVIIDLLEARLTITTQDVQTLSDFITEAWQSPRGRVSIIVDNFFETTLSMIFRGCAPAAMTIGIFNSYANGYDFLGHDAGSIRVHSIATRTGTGSGGDSAPTPHDHE